MTEQQDHTRRFAEEPTVTREQFVEASELAGIRYLNHDESRLVCAFAVQQEQTREAADSLIAELNAVIRRRVSDVTRAESERFAAVASAESLELSLRTACASRDTHRGTCEALNEDNERLREERGAALAVVAQVRETAEARRRGPANNVYASGGYEFAGEILAVVDTAAPDTGRCTNCGRFAAEHVSSDGSEMSCQIAAAAPEGEKE